MSGGDDRGVAGEILDYLFYAPVGLLATVAEEMPKYAARGRARLATARTIGEFAVTIGRRRAEKALGDLARSGPAGKHAAEAPGEAPARQGHTPAAREADAAGGSGDGADGADGDEADAGGHPVAPHAALPADNGTGLYENSSAGTAAPVTAPASLAIPGYDSLAASQVVQRLAGLSNEELEEVRRYEESTRGRRTILGRISQLSSTQGTAETG
jgi:hypothetical protein